MCDHTNQTRPVWSPLQLVAELGVTEPLDWKAILLPVNFGGGFVPKFCMPHPPIPAAGPDTTTDTSTHAIVRKNYDFEFWI